MNVISPDLTTASFRPQRAKLTRNQWLDLISPNGGVILGTAEPSFFSSERFDVLNILALT